MYAITKEQCQERINNQGDVVCNYCGSILEPIETIDNTTNPTFWAGCNVCERFNTGVPTKIYKIAEKLFDNNRVIPYTHLKRPDEASEAFKHYRWSQIGGITDIVFATLQYNNKL